MDARGRKCGRVACQPMTTGRMVIVTDSGTRVVDPKEQNARVRSLLYENISGLAGREEDKALEWITRTSSC